MSARTTGFDEFFDAHYDPVVRALALAFGDRSRAEDAAQEAFARALRKWPTVRAMERPVGWVYVVAANVARRAAKRDRCAEAADVGPEPFPDVSGPVVTRLSLREALALLPARQREVVVL